MYERFTDRARKVMQFANQEAQRFCHEYIGPEHIALGLAKEGNGVAANVLKNLNTGVHVVAVEVEKLLQPGPDMVTMGKLPQTPRAKKVIEYAIEEAKGLDHNYVGTEHLLLGLIRVEDSIAGHVLLQLGLTVEKVREGIRELLKDGHPDDVQDAFVTQWRKLVGIEGSQTERKLMGGVVNAVRQYIKAVQAGDAFDALKGMMEALEALDTFRDKGESSPPSKPRE